MQGGGTVVNEMCNECAKTVQRISQICARRLCKECPLRVWRDMNKECTKNAQEKRREFQKIAPKNAKKIIKEGQ